ncbi:ABC transporter substrate-binding protein [Streptomyces sp. NPDC087440]|uniref:ABC transporter substrate-binding protein n=1 Tax=Streptomyces sp. NPDC087440 TaxID=3365790 RepID=UPI00380D9D2C
MNPQRSSARIRQVAGAAVVVAALMTTAACGGGGDKKDEGKSGGKAAGFNAATGDKIANPSTKAGGTLKMISKQDLDSADPQRQYYGMAWDFSRFYSRQLVTYAAKPGNASAELVPDLAKANGKITNGGKTYTYELKDGIAWEDGTPITSKDIKYGISRLWAKEAITGGPSYLVQALDPGAKPKYQGPYKDKTSDGPAGIETPNDKTIVFNLATPNVDFEQMLAMPAGSPVKKEKDTGAKYQLKPFSSGPYKFESYSPKKSISLVRNDKWKKETDTVRAALPDKVTVTVNPNMEALDKLLIKGDYDVDMNGTGLTQSGRIAALQKHKDNVDNIQTSFTRYVDMAPVGPLTNVACRKAVIYATDFKSLQEVRGGEEAGGPLATTMLPTTIKGYDDYDPYGVKARGGKPDVAKAKEQLKACNQPNGFKTKISARSNNTGEKETAEALQQSLKAVNIQAEVEVIDGAESASITGSPTVVKQRGLGLIMTGWGPDFPTGQGFSQPLIDGRFIAATGNYNGSETNDPAINKMFDDALKATDPDKAAEFYKQINHKTADIAAQMPFLYEKNFSWRSSRLTNVYSSTAYNGRYDYASLGVVK